MAPFRVNGAILEQVSASSRRNVGRAADGSCQRRFFTTLLHVVRGVGDRRADIGAQRKCAGTDGHADDGKDQGVFGCGSARFITDERSDEIFH